MTIYRFLALLLTAAGLAGAGLAGAGLPIPRVLAKGARGENLAPPKLVPGTAIGNMLGPLANYQGSGFPSVRLSSRLIWSRDTTSATDFTDMQINRSTSYAGGKGHINSALRILGDYGAHDAAGNWAIISQAATNGRDGGDAVGGDFQGIRKIGASDAIWGAISDAIDLNDKASSLSGSGVVAHEFDLEANNADDAGNTNTYGGIGNRKILQIDAIRHNASNTTQAEISNGIWFVTATPSGASDTHTNYGSAIGFALNTQTYSVLDTRGAIAPTGSSQPVIAVNMAAGHAIDFAGGTTLNSAPRRYLEYNSTAAALQYRNSSGSVLFSVSDAGRLGSLTTTDVVGTVSSQPGTTYTFTAADCGTEVAFTGDAAITATIPATLPAGCNIAIAQLGLAKIAVNGAAVTAATLHSAHAYTGTSGQWAVIGINIAANPSGNAAVALLTGDGS